MERGEKMERKRESERCVYMWTTLFNDFLQNKEERNKGGGWDGKALVLDARHDGKDIRECSEQNKTVSIWFLDEDAHKGGQVDAVLCHIVVSMAWSCCRIWSVPKFST